MKLLVVEADVCCKQEPILMHINQFVVSGTCYK